MEIEDEAFLTDDEFAARQWKNLRRLWPLLLVLDISALLAAVFMIWDWTHGEESWYVAIPVLAISVIAPSVAHGLWNKFRYRGI